MDVAKDLHPKTTMVREVYNKLNVDTSFKCELNAHVKQEHKEIWAQLSKDIVDRYYGSGVSVPEHLEGKRILDIGCGSGSLVFVLSKLVGPTGCVVGVDVTDGLIETAKKHTPYHMKQWGYSKPNVEFHWGNAENMDTLPFFKPNSFDIIVSNGVLCLVPGKQNILNHAFTVLKEGGQFYLNDVYNDDDIPPEAQNNDVLWSLGTGGSTRWDRLATMTESAGFTAPYLTSAEPMAIVNPELRKLMGSRKFACSGWRLFKLPAGASKKGASNVTYNGEISGHPDDLTWDIDLTFKTGQPVAMDAELATLLASSYLASCFTFAPASGDVKTSRNQNPFVYMDKLKAAGIHHDPVYKIE